MRIIRNSGKDECRKGDDKRHAKPGVHKDGLCAADPTFQQHVREVIASLNHRDTPLMLPLDIRGTAFQQQVWQALCTIPCGETVSYQQLANTIGKPKVYFREGDPNDFADIPTLLSSLVAKVPDSQVLADLDHVASWASRNGGDVHRLMITGFCWGGRITWLYAAHNPQLNPTAFVVCYCLYPWPTGHVDAAVD